MAKFTDSLRGYAFRTVHRRDDFVCVYCGLDGKVWPNWLFLSWDHLLPRGHPERDNEEYIITACIFCNVCHNRTTFDVEGKTPAELIEQKKPFILQRRNEYRDFWERYVRPRPASNLSEHDGAN